MIIMVFLGISSSVFAQFPIRGKVTDGTSNEPVEFATVFVSNTSIGTITDKEGQFELSIPAGQFDLVVSFMGYSSKVVKIDSGEGEQFLSIELYSSDLELEERMVEAQRDPQWYKNLKIFEKFFLGSSINARKASILNPEVLILDDISKPGTLIAKAIEPLKIVNPNLGYNLTFVLVNFEYQEKENTLSYFGYPYFEEMELPARQMVRINRNRERAFNGSINHLMRTLYQNELEESGFVIYPAAWKQLPDNTFEEQLGSSKFEADSLLVRLNQVVFTYRKPVFVFYDNEREEAGFQAVSGRRTRDYQFSRLHLKGRSLMLYPNGGFYNPRDLYIEGYMAWEKVADLMPIDY